jgi:pimeloyl-ACP methyl ester carboxylesterase
MSNSDCQSESKSDYNKSSAPISYLTSYMAGFEKLKDTINYDIDKIDLNGSTIVRNFTFTSKSKSFSSFAPTPGVPACLADIPGGSQLKSLFSTPDEEISENRKFRYHVFGPPDKTKSLIILLHGFNERHWDKYLPMALRLFELTGHAVVLFPIAFHMNRAPVLWHNNRVMQKVSQYRRSLYPDIISSTLSNAAISVRLHSDPSRFFWSGLQSYEDLVDLGTLIREGAHPAFEANSKIHFFTYSIGTLLAEITIMTDPDGLFSESKFATFCGGPVFNRLSPVSKFILDSQANVQLYSFLVEHLDSHRRNDPKLEQVLGGSEVGRNFRALMNYRLDIDYRENKFRSLSPRVLAMALAQDEVVPPFEVINTLEGSRRDVGIEVKVFDFPYPYRHEDPFPATAKHDLEVTESFNQIFKIFGDFLTEN